MLFAFSSTLVFGQTNKEVKLSFEESGLSKDKYAAQFDRVENLALTNGNKSFVRTRAILFEGFETWPPTDWTIESPSGYNWAQDDGTDYGPGSAYEGDYAAMYNNYDYSTGTNGSMTTPAFDVSALGNPTVSFYWWNGDGSYSPATIEVLTSADGTTFTSLEVIDAYGTTDWVEYVSAIGPDVTHVKLTATSDYGSKNTFVDAFEVKELNLGPELALNYDDWDAGLAENNSITTIDGFVAYNGNLGDLEVTSATLAGTGFTTTFDMAAANAAFNDYTGDFTYSISLFDSYGDGWDGAEMDVLVNDVVVLEDITVADSQDDFTFDVSMGDIVSTVYRSGSYEWEHSYTIYDQDDNEVISAGPSPGPGVTFTLVPKYNFGFTFEPTTAGLHTATLTIVSNGGTQVIDLEGIAYAEGSLAESFETAVPPNGWEANILNGDYNWEKSAPGAMGDYSAMFNSYSAPIGASAELITPQLDLTTKADNMLYFYYAHPSTSYEDMLELYTSVDNGTTWVLLDEILVQNMYWNLFSYDLSAFSGDEFKVKFVAISDYGVDILVDMVVGPPIVNGNLAGYVWDEYTGESMEGATITLGSQSAMSNSFGLYSIEQIPIGTYPITCEYPGYNTISTTITITSENVTMLDFNMVREAEFSVNVDEYKETLEPNQSLAKTFTISNDAEVGAANLDYVVNIGFISKSSAGNFVYPSYLEMVKDKNLELASNSSSSNGLAPNAAPNASLYSDVVNRDVDSEAFAYCAYSLGAVPEGPMSFILNDPGNATGFGSEASDFISTADWVDGTWYGIIYGGTLVTIDMVTGAYTTIGSTLDATGMAYDWTTQTMYAVSFAGSLCTIDLATGAYTEVATTSGNMIAMACSNFGALYGFNLGDDTFGMIDKATGTWTEISSVGFDFSYGQDASFDHSTNTLYWAAYDVALGGELLTVDLITGAVSFIGAFDGGSEVTGFAIPGEPGPSEAWLTVTDGGTGSIAPGESADVDIFFDAFELVDVTKNANIVITHNGAVASKEMDSNIPAEMTVTPFIHNVSIFDIQFTTDPSGDSPLDGSTVRTTGVITAGSGEDGDSKYFLQDMEQTGSWTGILLYTYSMDFEMGDKVTVVGEVDEYYGMTEIKNVITDLTTVVSEGNTVPAPILVPTGSFSEQFEGVLVVVENAECTEEASSYGEWFVNDGTGDGMIDDSYYDYEPTLGNFYNVAGPLDYSYSKFKIQPRNVGDVEDITNETPWPPTNLEADVQYRDVVLTWGGAYGWYSYCPGITNITTFGVERAVYFSASDFGYSYPVEINAVSHMFYNAYGWGDENTFTVKIYDADGTTLLYESGEYSAIHYDYTDVYLDEIFLAYDDFYVAVVPTNPGLCTSLMSVNASGQSYAMPAPGDAWSARTYEYQTWVNMVGPTSDVTLNPSTTPISTDLAVEGEIIELDENEIIELNNVKRTESSKYLKSYNIYRNGLLLVDGITDLTYTDAGLADGVYTYYATTVYTVGESPASNVVSVQLFYGSMEGVVVDAEYPAVPIPDATIKSTDGIYETMSDSVGFFAFAEVEYGMHDFDVFAEGYYGHTFTDIEIVQNEITAVEFPLEREFKAPINVAVDPYYGIISWQSPFGLTYDDDFESYTLGGYIAEQSDFWTTWDGSVGGATDALISDEEAQSPTQSVKIDGATDLVLDFGNQTSGAWEVSFNILIPAEGDGGYYNLLHDFNGGDAEYAYELYLDEIGNGELHAAGEVIPVTYNAGEWNLYKTIINLDADVAELYINETMAYTWQWSLITDGTQGLNQLGAADVFSASLGAANPLYYVDDVSYGVLQGKEVVSTEETPEFLYYNVYLDDFQVTETSTSAYQYEGLAFGIDYVGSVSAIYSYMDELHESDIIPVAFQFLQTAILAPINLAAVVTNFNDVDLTWELPVTSRYLETILIFRDGELVDEIDGGINTYSEVLGTGLYEYYVQAKYTGFQMSAPSNTAIAEVTLYPPTNLTGESTNSDVALFWDAPAYPSPGANFTEGFEDAFPPTGWEHIQLDAETWEQVGTVSFSSGDVVPHEGAKQLEVYWSYGDQDEWMITPEFLADGTSSVTFWTYVALGNTTGDHYYLKVSTDGGTTWNVAWDASTEPVGENHYDYAVVVDLSAYDGENIMLAWQGYAMGGLWSAWFIDDVTVATEDGAYSFNGETLQRKVAVRGDVTEQGQLSRDGLSVVSNNVKALTGYNIYRNDELIGTSTLRFYFDEVGDGTYTYWVKANYDGFESDTSNNVTLSLITGIDEIAENKVSLYPNPASNLVNVTSTHEMNRLTVTNYVGQVVYTSEDAGTRVELNTNSYQPGVYLVKIETESGVVTKRVIIRK